MKTSNESLPRSPRRKKTGVIVKGTTDARGKSKIHAHGPDGTVFSRTAVGKTVRLCSHRDELDLAQRVTFDRHRLDVLMIPGPRLPDPAERQLRSRRSPVEDILNSRSINRQS